MVSNRLKGEMQSSDHVDGAILFSNKTSRKDVRVIFNLSPTVGYPISNTLKLDYWLVRTLCLAGDESPENLDYSRLLIRDANSSMYSLVDLSLRTGNVLNTHVFGSHQVDIKSTNGVLREVIISQ